MGFSGGLLDGYEFHSELIGELGSLALHPPEVALLVVLLALVGVFLALGEHSLDEIRAPAAPGKAVE